MSFTLEIARSLAPDAGTLARAEALTNPRRWLLAERNERALWGETKGINNEIYRTIVDMNGPAYQCSCPVKRFPCKHALALLLMAASEDTDTLGTNPPPQYVVAWLDTRDGRALAKTMPRTDEQIAQSEASKEKTRHERLKLMEAGINDLQKRLLDILRDGIAHLDTGTEGYWQDFSARMVDAKMGGLAKRIKSWANFKEKYPHDWYERLLSELGAVYMMTKAFKNFDKIPENLQTEILIQAGMTIKKEDILNQEGYEDDWLVMAQIETKEEDNLTSRRVWLLSKAKGKIVLVLDYAFGNIGFPNTWINGYVYHAEVVFYPAAYPLRVAVKKVEIGKPFSQIIGYQNFTQFFDAYSKAVSKNLWLGSFPVLMAEVVPIFYQNTFCLLDFDKKYIKMDISQDDNQAWQCVAISGGNPIALFGEWNGEYFTPLSIFAHKRYIAL